MDPIGVADFILGMSGGIVVIFFTAGYGVSVTAASRSRDLPGDCFVVSYQDTASVASMLACFAAISVLCALTIKYICKRADNGNAEADLVIARRLVYILVPLAVITHILAVSFFVMVHQYRAGKISCWSLRTRVFVFGALGFELIVGVILGVICRIYGTPPVPLAAVPLAPVAGAPVLDDALHLPPVHDAPVAGAPVLDDALYLPPVHDAPVPDDPVLDDALHLAPVPDDLPYLTPGSSFGSLYFTPPPTPNGGNDDIQA